jgi:hypothetical protein
MRAASAGVSRAVTRGPLPPCAARVIRSGRISPSWTDAPIGRRSALASRSGRKPVSLPASATKAPAMAGATAVTRPR